MEIAKSTIIAEILKQKGAEEILAKYSVPCLSCPMASMELSSLKIGDVCETYGIDCEKLLTELSQIESEGEEEGKLRRGKTSSPKN